MKAGRFLSLMQIIDGYGNGKRVEVRSHSSPIILSRLQNARAAFSGENIALKALDKW
jgi:hypothetical protein